MTKDTNGALTFWTLSWIGNSWHGPPGYVQIPCSLRLRGPTPCRQASFPDQHLEWFHFCPPKLFFWGHLGILVHPPECGQDVTGQRNPCRSVFKGSHNNAVCFFEGKERKKKTLNSGKMLVGAASASVWWACLQSGVCLILPSEACGRETNALPTDTHSYHFYLKSKNRKTRT